MLYKETDIEQALKNYVTEKPSARLDEMVRYLQDEFQVKVDESTVSRTIRLHQWRAPMEAAVLTEIRMANMEMMIHWIQQLKATLIWVEMEMGCPLRRTLDPRHRPDRRTTCHHVS